MNLRIKTKLSLGLAFLFTVIVLIAGVGLYSINRLAEESKTILKANYESLQFSKEMLQALDRIELKDSAGWTKFENSLVAQENNITEIGEKEITAEVHEMFYRLKSVTGDKATINEIRQGIYHVLELNMNAIVRKNNEAQQTAGKARVYLAIIGTFCFLVSFSFILNFPGYIANPVKELTEGIKAISNKNYSQRIHLKKGDEFGELAEAFNTMAQQLDDYENSNLAKIIFEKKRIETIINNMSDPIIGFDEQNRILFANTAAIKILGIPEQDFIGKYAPDVALKNDLLRNLMTKSGSLTPLKIFANNKESYFTKEVVSIISEDQPIGDVIMLRNITQFKELDVSKTNFIATISHELKTPISSIKMSVKLLADKRVGEMNSEQKELVENIHNDSERLLKITGELLDLAQVESGEIHLQKRPVAPASIVNYAYNAMKFQAEQKAVNVRINIEPGVPEINCDLEKTAWVLVNFLSNAIRYSPEKSDIKIDVKKLDAQVLFSVHDSGKGIDPKYKERIFEKFYQVPSTDTAKTGTGLGLAISKDFIEAQGGKIWMESEIGTGSTFSFSLNV
ncbi:MAG: HAMP domain-containing protein [Bacteroidetes bacterium]|nr:HAMP domain-containing protein [Bacteroidota bacterium]